MTTTDMQAAFDAYYAENWPLCKALIEKGTASEEITDEREALWDTWQDAWKAALASRPDAQESLASENVAKDSPPKVSQGLAQADERGERQASMTAYEQECQEMAAEGIKYWNDRYEGLLASVKRAAPQAATMNGIPATLRHDEGAIARCSYCGRYSIDPKTLSDRQPACDCGERYGWSGSFEKPGRDAKWNGEAPTTAPQAEAAQGVAEGYALVPIELTPEMVKAGSTSGGLGMDFHEWMGRIKHAWRHMLAAAPSPDREQVGEAADCCDTPSYCSSVRRCTAKDQ